jgi:hypothetical protein
MNMHTKLAPIALLAALFIAVPAHGMDHPADSKSSVERKINAEEANQSYKLNNRTLASALVPEINQWVGNSSSYQEAWLNCTLIPLGNHNADDRTKFCQRLNDTTIAMTSATGALDIWDVTTGKLVQQIPTQAVPIKACMQLNKTTLVFSTGTTVTLWDMATKQPLVASSAHDQPISNLLKFSDTLIIGSSYGNIYAWDLSAYQASKPETFKPIKLMERDIWGLGLVIKASKTHLIYEDGCRGLVALNIVDIHKPQAKILKTMPFINTKSLIRLSESCIACSAALVMGNTHGEKKDRLHPDIRIINWVTDTLVKDFIHYDDKYHAGGTKLCALSPTHFASLRKNKICLWNFDDTNMTVDYVAALKTNIPSEQLLGLAGDRFMMINKAGDLHEIYQFDLKEIRNCYALLPNAQRRLQALVNQLRRLKATSTEPLQLTAWGEKWLAAMPEAIQKRLRANFNIKH